jgi:hypothetical protein
MTSQLKLQSACLVPMYQGIICTYFGSKAVPRKAQHFVIERVQTGVRLERRLLKVLKALAGYRDMSLGDLLEGIVLHAFEGKAPFSAETRRKITELKAIYGLDLDARASHRLQEMP